jgi:penicillin-binding protein activator
MKLSNLILAAAVVVGSAGAIGCNSTGDVRDVGVGEEIKTLGLDIQDFRKATLTLANQFLSRGVLNNAPRQPAILQVSSFINNTAEQVDPDLVLFNVTRVLNETGKLQAINEKDVRALEEVDAQGRLGRGGGLPRADYSVTTKLIQLSARAGNTRQVTYVFQMELTDMRSGTVVWYGGEEIVKQSNRPQVRF